MNVKETAKTSMLQILGSWKRRMRPDWIAILIFSTVVALILRRPWKMNEAVPAFAGAVLLFILHYVSISDVFTVFHFVSGAATITVSTIIMSSILDKSGFFRWSAQQMAEKAGGNGRRLFFYSLLLSFLMTLFFNNDGSILITTPIFVELTKALRLTKTQSVPILLGGALIATSSSAPIGVSNIANLIALKIVGLNLNTYAVLMFVPAMVGISLCAMLLYCVFRKNLSFTYEFPIRIKPTFPPAPGERFHPHHRIHHAELHHERVKRARHHVDLPLLRVGVAIVVAVRAGFFVAAALNWPPEYVALFGALLLLMYYAMHHPKGVGPILRSAPWHIIVFALSMYLLVYSLRNIGLTAMLGGLFSALSGSSLLGSILTAGGLLTVMSCVMNNLPSVMIGTLMLTGLHLPVHTTQLSYLANILGSDIGSLLLPMGTLASLLWFHIITKAIRFTWIEYMRVTMLVIPPSLLAALISLWGWGHLFMT